MRIPRRNSFIFTCSVILGFCSIIYLLIANIIELRKLNEKSFLACQDGDSGMISINGKLFPKPMSGINQLPELPFPPQNMNKMRKTLQIPLFTLTKDIKIGQILFELFSLLGISETLQREPVISDTVASINLNVHIGHMFPLLAEKFGLLDPLTPGNFSIDFNTKECCVFHDTSILANFPLPHLTLKGYYFQSFKYFQNLQSEVRTMLTPSQIAQFRAELMIPPIYRNNFKICTHIRRPDEKKLEVGSRKPSDGAFTRKATDYLVQKYKKERTENVTVFIMGNDPLWAETIFSDRIPSFDSFGLRKEVSIPNNYIAFLTPSLNVEDDIAFSQQYCDIFLLTAPSSSFGWWLAYLSKPGSTVFYRDIVENNEQITNELHPDDYFPTEWKVLKFVDDQRIEETGF